LCKVETTTGSFSVCVSGTCPVLNKNSTTGVYGYSSGGNWVPTPFTRDITINNINVDEISVAVTVSWSTGVLSKNFTIRENFLNWQ